MDTLGKAILQTKLTPDTVDSQFCSDWLKGQMHQIISEFKALEAELDRYRETLQKIADPAQPMPTDGRDHARVYEDWANDALKGSG